MTMRLRIYLAGPEVFLPDAKAVGAAKAAMCAGFGFEGCFPLDNALDLAGLDKRAQARRILDANEALMRRCDLVVANATPFRGVAMDSGTACEVGFMRALGRPVFAYSNAPSDYAVRARHYRAGVRVAEDCDRADIEIEDFDLAENLMIASAAEASGTGIVRPDDGVARPMQDLMQFRRCLERVTACFGRA
jgi:nucleoside 2-deoxyribosyltransferase